MEVNDHGVKEYLVSKEGNRTKDTSIFSGIKDIFLKEVLRY